MTRLKQGDLLKQAKAGGKKITFAAVKKRVQTRVVAPAKIRAPKKAAPAAAGNKYAIQVKKTPRGQWQTIGLGGNNLEAVKQIARMYANNYPRFSFRVV
jgi:hypothetical protein